MRTLGVALAVLATAMLASTPPARADGEGPVILRSGTSYRLALPRAMDLAIQRAIPGFRPQRFDEYPEDVRAYYRCTSRQAPWAVVGDFDGDGSPDVIVDGRANDRCYMLCVWGRPGTPVDTLEAREGDRCNPRSGTVLMYVPPGDRGTNFSDDSIFIFTDAFDVYTWEKAGSTWYWKDGRWNEWMSSD